MTEKDIRHLKIVSREGQRPIPEKADENLVLATAKIIYKTMSENYPEYNICLLGLNTDGTDKGENEIDIQEYRQKVNNIITRIKEKLLEVGVNANDYPNLERQLEIHLHDLLFLKYTRHD